MALVYLVEVSSLQRWIAATALGIFYFVDGSGVFFNLPLVLMAMLGVSFILGYVMSINDCFDVDTDKIKSKLSGKKIVVSEDISFESALVFSLVLVSFGLLLSLLVSVNLFVVSLLLVILSTLYSVPPIRYKDKYPYSTLGESIGAFLPFLGGYAVFTSIDYKAIIIAAIFALITVYGRLIHESHYAESDKGTGKKTVAVIRGRSFATRLATVCLMLSIVETAILFVLGWVTYKFLPLYFLYLLLALLPFWRHTIPLLLQKILWLTWGLLIVLLSFTMLLV